MGLRWRQWLTVVAIAVPFLNPFAPGPSPHVVPLLVGCGCTAFLLIAYDARCKETVVQAWIAAAIVGAAIGLLQYFDLAWPYAPWINAASPGEAYGNLRQRNQFATFMNIGVAALYWALAGQWERSRGLQLGQHWKLFCASGLLVVANAATASRIGLLQLLLIVMLAIVWSSPWRTRFAVIGAGFLGAYALAAWALPWLLTALTGAAGRDVFTRLIQEEGCSGRDVLWSNAIDLIRERPWTGWGWGNMDYAHYVTLYPGERFCGILDNAHNLPLHLAVELGVPAAVIACLGLAAWVIRRAPWRAPTSAHRLAWTLLAIVSLHSLVEYPLWYAPFQMTVGLCVLLLWSPSTSRASSFSGALWLRTGSAVLLFLFVVVASRDYFRVSQLYLHPEDRSHAWRYFTTTDPGDLVFFHDQAEFAHLSTTAMTRENASSMAVLAKRLLPYSPEPRVIEMLIESLTLTDDQAQAVLHLSRYRAAFPAEFEAWKQRSRQEGAAARKPSTMAQ